jgi:hypothetical protein
MFYNNNSKSRSKSHMKRQTLAVSTILTVILILIAAIVGALVAYMWTMAPFYLEPENAVDLIVTDTNFPVNNAKYFNVTVMNPSHSVSAANITDIYITAPGFNRTSATDSNPELPFVLDRGTTQTINCSLLWGDLAGKLVTVHVATANNTGAERSVQTQDIRLGLNTFFNASQSINYFNISVTSISSPINLSLSRVLFDFYPLNNTNLNTTLPVIQQGQTIGLTCYVRWEGFVNPLIRVETTEGYAAEKQADARGTVSLQVTEVTFNDTNVNEVDVTLFNSPDSAVGIDVSNIILTHGNITYAISGNLSNPALPMSIDKNRTVVFACTWSWSDSANRDIDITVNANTTQGFVSVSKSVRTPPRVAANMTAVNFDLDNTGSFTINVTNLRYSLDTVNVTSIDLNQTVVGTSPILLVPGQQATISCTFNWSAFVGQNARIIFHVNSSSNAFPNFYDTHVSYLKVTNADFSAFSEDSLYANVTVRNSEFSKVNATITGVQVRTDNATFSIAGVTGYEIDVGSEGAIVCPWNWKPYQTQNVIIIVYTADGTQASATFEIP